MVPASARTQYDHDGIAYDKDLAPSLSSVITHTTSTAVASTTIIVPLVDDPQGKHVNGTITKKPFRKGDFSFFFILHQNLLFILF